MIMNGIIIFSIKGFIGRLYTNDEDVINLINQTLPIVLSFLLFDGVQGVSNGILTGCGRYLLL
jgi:multidrug resistance protein, MATE family